MPNIEQLTTPKNAISPTPPAADDAVGVAAANPPSTSPGAAPAPTPDLKWFVAIVNNRSEKRTAALLESRGIQTYVATQEQIRVRPNGRRVKVEQTVIPAKIFVRATEAQRRHLVELPCINRFLTTRANNPSRSLSPSPSLSRAAEKAPAPRTSAGRSPLRTPPSIAIVTNAEIEILKFMLGQSDHPVTLTDSRPFTLGQKVKVIRGQLQGLTGEITRLPAPLSSQPSLSAAPTTPSSPHTPSPKPTPSSTLLTVRIPILGYALVTIDSSSLSPLP